MYTILDWTFQYEAQTVHELIQIINHIIGVFRFRASDLFTLFSFDHKQKIKI